MAPGNPIAPPTDTNPEPEPPTRIGSRQLRESLATVLRRASEGERIVITVDGRPAAELGPVGASGRSLTIDDLAATGAVIAPQRSRPEAGDRPAIPPSDLSVDRLINHIRGGDRRP